MDFNYIEMIYRYAREKAVRIENEEGRTIDDGEFETIFEDMLFAEI